ncbi:hypothetical protein EXU48_22100 [Occultella glacieicola]|uniref:Alginate lyase domain-containing protein n=1 Tax=Occultella glacieicola TaxID=2518684 RepID=A0ABY2DYE7_9MICO|nr:heparinase II/III family protein [Occultella glacieicola]TDE88785.1 hypothetical protein EXU48_22100 [Occultella glacieicola]
MPHPTPAEAPSIAPSTIPNWADVRSRVARTGWAADTLDAVRADFEHWQTRLRLPGPDQVSAWTHHYFCDDDGEPLRFDSARPNEHVCPGCGRTYRGDPWDGAWRTRMHNMAAAQSQRAALLARLGDDEDSRAAAGEALTRIVTHYASHYRSYELHGVNVGKARVTPQNLDESVWIIGLLRSVRWAGPHLAESTRAAARALAADVADVLAPQLGMIHNIHCWIVAALAECAVATGDAELLATATDGPFGARAQLLEGMHPEGLWFEVNPHYHFYAVNALLSFVEVAGPEALAGEPAQRLLRAVQAPAELAYTDGRVPAYGDGWPDSFLGTFAQTAEVASALLPGASTALVPPYLDDRPAPVQVWFGAGHVAGPSGERVGRYSVGALVFGAETLPDGSDGAQPGSFVWRGPGIGLLRSRLARVAIRFGPDAGWHDHHDKLAVDVECGQWRSLDLGTSGYGADITVWMRSQVAHNVIVVGDRPQPPHDGELVHADDRSLTARSSWNGAEVSRSLALTGSGWTDELQVVCDPGTPLEWLFHGDGTIVAATGAAVEPPTDDLGHAWLTDVRALSAHDGAVDVTWDHPDAPRLSLTMPAGWTALRADAPANPSGLPLGVVAVRGPALVGTTTLRATFVVEAVTA